MTKLTRGLYQSIVTKALQEELATFDEDLIAQAPLHKADVADRIATHIARVVEHAIAGIDEDDRVSLALTIAQSLIESTAHQVKDPEIANELLIHPGSFLTAIRARLPDGRPQVLQAPLIPLLDTALLTNAPGEPRVGSQILAEVQSADRIDVVMAFIRRSGIRHLVEELARHCATGRELRVLTTTYTGSTEAEALDELEKLGAQIKISYDETSTRLHAKAWLFHRETECSTAYIGSSNLTHSAQVSGLEWNVRFSAIRNKPVVDKVAAMFNAYWQSGDFVRYDRQQFDLITRPEPGPTNETTISPLEIRLEPFQERMLEQIELARLGGHHRNLLVSATGTGKTVMAAMDYARLRSKLPRSRLLFVVHRKEILQQAQATFRHAVRDGEFGELWVDGHRPKHFDHVFASVQSLNANTLQHLAPDHFDVVIVDEFHHAEAPSYRRLLTHLKPAELLGLTATPERTDDLDLLHWFDHRIAAELRLWDAIDQQRLAPFNYFGVADDLDYTSIPWKRGTGYDVAGVTKLLTANDIWAKKVINELIKRVDNVHRIRALGFCVSVEHAGFMARIFNENNIKAVAIWADTPVDARKQALNDLANGNVKIVFSVDLFNEGVDVPTVDTLLMLRPTDSATLFLQQLGRGLRKHHSKTVCTVLDFVGLHRKEYRFDRRLGTLVKGSRQQIASQVEQAFPYLPAGCHIQLDRIATERVLANIKAAVPANFRQRIDELRALSAVHGDVSIKLYLRETGLSLSDIYSSGKTWSDYREAADLPVLPPGPSEQELRKACGRMLHVDDALRIDGYIELLKSDIPRANTFASSSEKRLLRMLVASMTSTAVSTTTTLEEACALMRQHPQPIQEMIELLSYLREKVEHVPIALGNRPNVPLCIHAQYTRIEIQAAFGDGEKARPPTWREGVRYIKGESCDVFVFTRVKNEKTFSPTTQYKDYAINRELIHWESQSVTRADSETGLRYQNHARQHSEVMLFARHTDNERAFYFIGPAIYVSHQSEKPMQVTWRLLHPLPGDLYSTLAAAVA